MRILTDEMAIKDAQRVFEQSVSRASAEMIATSIGHPHGQVAAVVYWVPGTDIWGYFGLPPDTKSRGTRYWNAFGIGKPTSLVSITCEINPPVRGIDRRPAGAFAESGGKIYVLHRGTFNAFRGRIPREFLRQNFHGTWVQVEDGNRVMKLIQIGCLSDTAFVGALAQFVREAGRLKELYKGL